MTDRVTITHSDRVATITMTRADKRNALDLEMLEALSAAGEALKPRKDVRAVVLAGDGPSFCSGLDLMAMPKLAQIAAEGGGITARTHGQSNLFQHVAIVWRELPMPVIAAVQGLAYGGGLQIMMGADMRVAAPDCKFAVMEGKWGIIPDMGLMVTARRLVREDVLRRLTYTAEVFEAHQALEWGFVTELHNDPLARATELATTIAGRNPDAVRAGKDMISRAGLLNDADALLLEAELQEPLIGSPNQMEAVMAGMETRAPNFRD